MKLSLFTSIVFASIAPVLLTGCQSQELATKREQQEVEIARLKGELKLVDEQIKSMPPDRSKELVKAREQEKAQIEQIDLLKEELAELQKRKLEVEEKFENYRSKYVVK